MNNNVMRLVVGLFLGLAFGQSVYAGATGDYFGIGGGFSFLQDENFDIRLQAGNNGGFLGVGGTAEPADFETDYGLGYLGSLTFGVIAENGLRGEFEIRYSSNDIDSIKLNGNSSNTNGTAVSAAVMGNLYYDFNRQGRLHPYLGAGVGGAFIDISDVAYSDDGGNNKLEGDDRVIAYQGAAGVAFDLTDRLTADVGYRYFDTLDPDFTDDEVKVDFGYTQHIAQFSLRYVFHPTGRIDSDGDGVYDARDKCPNTPAGTSVDSDGCPLDGDGDKVPDFKDQCPNTAQGVAVDDKGCILDADGDEVPDKLDECPNTAAGVAVNDRGCPKVIDTDGDGVADNEDVCPGTPPDVAVLSNGCAANQKFILKGVNYEYDSAQLTPQAMQILDNTAQVLKDSPGFRVELQGHTDAKGADSYNQKLSQARAQSAREYLINQGVQADRIEAKGYGESRPIAPNSNDDGSDNPQGRAENRRTELKVLE